MTTKTIEKLSQQIRNYTSPAFIYDLSKVESQYTKLREALPQKFEIFYAQKSNPHHSILKLLKSLGAGCDTASLGEMESAFKADFEPEKIMLTGPAKTEDELTYAISNNILSINAESLQEIYKINELAEMFGKVQEILIRINPGFEAGETNRIIGGSGVSKFGIDAEQIGDVVKETLQLKNISICGIHIFNSSQVLNWQKIFNNTKEVFDTAISLSDMYGFELKRIDLGGGFGIPYSASEEELDVGTLGENLSSLLSDEYYSGKLKNTLLIFEPGRYLSGQCGIYLTKVLYTKTSHGTEIVMIDGGIHHLLRPALIGQSHQVVNLTAKLENRVVQSNYMIAGPLCTSLDEFGTDIEMLETKPGDILGVLNAGAYGYTESMPLFLSHPFAKEILI